MRRITDRIDLGDEIGCGLFAGVHMLESSIFDYMPEQPSFESMRDLYVPMLGSGVRVAAWLQPSDAIWWPVGTPRELLDANLLALERAVVATGELILADGSARVEGGISGPAWIGANATIGHGAHIGPGSVISAGAQVSAGTVVQNSLFLPGTRSYDTSELHRAIVHDHGIWRDG